MIFRNEKRIYLFLISMFTTITYTEQSVPCVVPEGRLDTVNSSEFDRELSSIVQNELYVIVDFLHCNYMSSTGLRVLLSTEKKLKANGGALYISSVLPEVFQVFEMAGLHKVFHFSNNRQIASEEIIRLKQTVCDCKEWEADGYHFLSYALDNPNRTALIWKDQGIVGYNELGFSVGTGWMAESLEEGTNYEGLFLTAGNSAGFIPNNESLLSDFRISNTPSQSGVFVNRAISFGQDASVLIKMDKSASITLQQFSDLLCDGNQQSVVACAVANFNQVAPSISFYIVIDQPLSENLMKDGFHLSGLTSSTEAGICLWGARFELSEIEKLEGNCTLSSFLKKALVLQAIEEVKTIDLSEQLVDPVAWLFTAEDLIDASTYRIALDVPNEGFSEPYKAFLTRRLYGDSSKVVLKALHGGFSAQTFQATSFDKYGRKLRPTVLKIANRAMITREADRCKQYSLPYILNNSAIVLGTEFFGDYGALCYNFVGIGGEETQLKWLTNYFDEWPVEKLEPLFDKIFIRILNPWYGQPVREAIYPFLDHDPTLTFFSTLCETSEEVLSFSSDEPFFIVQESGQKLVNPYWFLKFEYPKRRNDAVDYYTAICHGDLNMQNILLDQDMNVYLIDFSETKPRSVISDFARLEAIFMVERTPIETEGEMKAVTEFITRFYSIDQLDQLPVNSYQGSNSNIVDKNILMTLKMREYAIRSVNGNTNLVPYYMALLEWVLPVVCYSSAPMAHKRLSMIVAGLLCEKVMKLLPK
jgi:anti-anti-sigma factor